MLACPFVVSDFSDAEEATIESAEKISISGFLELLEESNYDLVLEKDYYITDNSGKIVLPNDSKINGNGHTIFGALGADCILDSGESETVTIVINNLVLNGERESGAYLSQGINVQNQRGTNDSSASDENKVRFLDLTLDECRITNFTWKGLYLTNTERLVVNNCEFENIATKNPQDIKSGDHAIDLVLVEVQDAEITITNNRFIGHVGANASIQIQQRGSDNTDDQATDMDPQVDATIKSVLISGNDFSRVTSTDVDVRLGSWPKENDVRTYTKAFPSSIIADGETVVASCTELGGDGVNNDDFNMFVKLSNGSEFRTVGGLTKDADGKTSGLVNYYLDSGHAVLSGYVPDYMTITVEKGASAVLQDLENYGTVNSVDNNISGTPIVGSPVVNTNTEPSTSWDDDEDLPPFIPSQSSNDDTVTIVACAAAAAVAAILAVFLVIDRKG